jgi:ribosomal protein S12 methylthiotransferase accessory factor
MEILVTFPGGARVAAAVNGQTVMTDQPVTDGGTGTAPSPYELFLASLGTCAGYYVLSFCQQRGIATDEISVRQSMEFASLADGKRKLVKVSMAIQVPPSFPEKYHNALVKSAEICAVKKVLQDPPEFVIATVVR